MGMADLSHITEAEYDRHFNLNVKGALFLAQKCVPHMPTTGGGRIIFVSTNVTVLSGIMPNYLLYAATKGAVDQFVRLLSKDLGPKGITVNAVAPGPTGTELFYEGKSEQTLQFIRSWSPFKRIGEPDEIASVVAFLAGEDSRWVSGQIIRVNGAAMV